MLVAGCGGGGKRLTREEYAAKADAICAESKRRTKPFEHPRTLPQFERSAEKIHSIFEETASELRKLRPPESQQALADRWLESLDVLKNDLERLQERAKERDRNGLQAVAQTAMGHDKRANDLATQLGMRVCNSD